MAALDNGRSGVARVVASRFISFTGSEGAFFVGIWGKATFQLHATPTDLAVVMLSLSIGAILGNLVAGVLVDRYGPRRVLALGELVFIPATLGMALAGSFAVLVPLVGFWAFTSAPVHTAGASFAPFLVEPERLSRANAWIEGGGSAALLAGPAIAALIAHYTQIGWVFVFDAVTSLVGAALVWGVRTAPVLRAASAERHPLGELLDGLRTVYRDRALRFYVLGGFVAWMSFGAFAALEPLFFRDIVHTGVETIGWVNVVFGAGLLVGAALLARLPGRFIAARWLALFLAASGLCAWLYVGSADLRRIAFGAAVWGVMIGMLEPLMRTLIHRDTPEELVGRVIGTAEVHRRTGELIPLAFAPALAALFGVQATLIGGGLFASMIALLALGEAAAIDREPHRAAGHPPLAAEPPLPPTV